MSPSIAIELAPFCLAATADEDALLAAAERLEREFFRASEGYLGRALSKLPDGRWVDLVLWRSAADAAVAMSRIRGSPACKAYLACIAGGDDAVAGVEAGLLTAVRTFGALALV